MYGSNRLSDMASSMPAGKLICWKESIVSPLPTLQNWRMLIHCTDASKLHEDLARDIGNTLLGEALFQHPAIDDIPARRLAETPLVHISEAYSC
jgi:hypothetical protein